MAQELLIVVGAGASKEVGLPIGTQLKEQIANLVNFRHESAMTLSHGDSTLRDAIQYGVQSKEGDVQKFLNAARRISTAMPQAISIDNFIHQHAGDSCIEFVGKLGIVQSILKAEQNSKLYIRRHSSGTTLNFSALEDYWLTKFFRLLTEDCRVADLSARMAAVTMIVFNYDRCVEHFLYHALQNYYGIDGAQAAELIAMMKIYHPYGKVGPLPWEEQELRIEFGADQGHSSLLTLIKGIKTFNEGTDPSSSEIIDIRERAREAKLALFLGFAFHRLNLKLLFPNVAETNKRIAKRYFATTYGMSSSDSDAVREELTTLGTGFSERVVVRNNLFCHQLFNEYGRSISLV